MAELKSAPCSDCHRKFPSVCMDFDHVRGRKLFDIAQGKELSMASVRREIKKCDLVCANCHRIRSFPEQAPVDSL